jgi:hypothetical protein
MRTLGERLARLFMDSHQRALVRPEDYDKPIDARAVANDLRQGTLGILRDGETASYALETAESYVESRRPMSIASLWADCDQLWELAQRENYADLREMFICSRLGANMLAEVLTERANALARSVKPGATDALGDAFTRR